MQPEVFKILTDSTTRNIFGVVARERSVRLTDLMGLLDENPGKDAVSTALGNLKDRGLIAEESAPLKEWAVFYVTSQGLDAERELRRVIG